MTATRHHVQTSPAAFALVIAAFGLGMSSQELVHRYLLAPARPVNVNDAAALVDRLSAAGFYEPTVLVTGGADSVAIHIRTQRYGPVPIIGRGETLPEALADLRRLGVRISEAGAP